MSSHQKTLISRAPWARDTRGNIVTMVEQAVSPSGPIADRKPTFTDIANMLHGVPNLGPLNFGHCCTTVGSTVVPGYEEPLLLTVPGSHAKFAEEALARMGIELAPSMDEAIKNLSVQRTPSP